MGTHGTQDVTDQDRARLTRRALLKSGGALVGGVGAVSVLAACRGAGVAAWTPMPSPSSRLAMAPKASPIVAEVAPSATPMARRNTRDSLRRSAGTTRRTCFG